MSIDMWNWLLDCYNKKLLTVEDMRKVLIDDEVAEILWIVFCTDNKEFVEDVRDEVKCFLRHLSRQGVKT